MYFSWSASNSKESPSWLYKNTSFSRIDLRKFPVATLLRLLLYLEDEMGKRVLLSSKVELFCSKSERCLSPPIRPSKTDFDQLLNSITYSLPCRQTHSSQHFHSQAFHSNECREDKSRSSKQEKWPKLPSTVISPKTRISLLTAWGCCRRKFAMWHHQ